MAGNIDVGSGGKRHRATAEVNVTPFVDVMLVLLIVFMVAAPLATVAVPFSFSDNRVSDPALVEPVFVSLQEDGRIFVGTRSSGETVATWATFGDVLRQKTGGDPNRQILVRADQKAPYAEVMRLMDVLQRGGYTNKQLVTEDVVD